MQKTVSVDLELITNSHHLIFLIYENYLIFHGYACDNVWAVRGTLTGTSYHSQPSKTNRDGSNFDLFLILNQVVITRNYRANSPRDLATYKARFLVARPSRDLFSVMGEDWKLGSELGQSITVAIWLYVHIHRQ